MNYKIIGKYVKELNFNIPKPETFFLLSKDISNYKINIDIKSSQIKQNIIDSCIIEIFYKNKISATLFLSYATAYNKSIKFFMSNSIIEYQNNKLDIFYPRKTFSKEGLFIKPKRINQKKYSEDFASSSLTESVKYFIKVVSTSGNFPISEFNDNIKRVESLLKAKVHQI